MMKIDQQMRKTGSIWWFIFGLALLALVFPLFAQDARFDSYEDDGAVAAEVSFAGSDFNILDIADDVGDYDNEEEEEEDNTKWRKKHEKVDKPKVTNVKHSQQQQSKPLKTTRNSDTKSTTMVDNHYNHNSWPEKYPRGSIRDQFTRDFHARCDKYSFVHRYYQMLEQPNQKYLIFLYHDRGLRNGGFGDRMGGMVTAFIHAMRFNRTLLIKASNGMHDMFRPYHPKDVYDHIHLDQSDNNEDNNSHVEGKYLWSNAKEWSKFSTWKESLTQSNNNKQNKSKKQKQSEDHFYEMEDLSDCVSNMEEGFTDAQTSRCAIDHQTKQDLEDKPVIRFASNRAYLCRYTNQPKTIKSHREVLKALNISTKNETDYFEVAGCMLRLMMWPTNALWKEVDQAYEDLLLKTYQKEHNDAKNAGAKKKQNQKKVEENQKQMLLPEPTTATMKKMYPLLSSIHGSTAEHLPFTLNPNPPLLVGLHFRCGDRHSYAKFLLNTDGFDEDACVVDSPYDIGDTGDEPGQKSKYLRAGNPAGIGQCANFYLKYFNQNKKKAIPQDDPHGFFVIPRHHHGRNSSTLLFVTSDNIRAEEQMRDYAKHAVTITSPQGCHIEYDPSKACYVFTTRYWFMLSLSEIIISQTFGELNAPTSAFSRYGAIYRLHQDNPFRSGRYCGDTVHSWQELSRFQQANWFC